MQKVLLKIKSDNMKTINTDIEIIQIYDLNQNHNKINNNNRTQKGRQR